VYRERGSRPDGAKYDDAVKTRRPIRKGASLLLLAAWGAAGAAVNVAVAWGCCARFDAYPGNIDPMAQADIDALRGRYMPSQTSRTIEIAVEVKLSA